MKAKPCLALLCSFLAVLACSSPQTPRQSAETGEVLVLDDFESEQSLEQWDGPGSISTAKVAHGNSALRLDLSDRTRRRLVSESLTPDWSGYDLLKFDIYSPGGTVEMGGLQIYDELGSDEAAELHGQSYRGQKLFLNPGWNHVEFILGEAMVEEGDRPLALEGIRRVVLTFGRGLGEVYLDNIRLVAGSEPASTASATDPRDCRVVIRNRFVFPSLTGPEEEIEVSPDIARLRVLAREAMDELKRETDAAEMQGYQTYYWKIPLITAKVGMDIRSKLVWFQNEEKEREILEYVIESCRRNAEKMHRIMAAQNPGMVELPEDEVNPHIFYVPDYPRLKGLKQHDGYFRDAQGRPVIIYSMLSINSGPLMDYFAPFNHRLESYTVGGGSRYDIESSPVYEAFHNYENTQRVGWDGWCGHLIKDRWSMGGRKESVVICLENPHIRQAVREYTEYRYNLWKDNPDLLYNIMAYELMYICYCETSQRMFRDWLRAKHGSIARVNQTWGTSYGSFAQIQAPRTENSSPVADVNRAAWYDWAMFNARRFTDYLKWCKANIRRLDREIPITSGGTSSMLSSANSTTGIDEEIMINEVNDVILNESGHSHIFSDLLTSLSDEKKAMVEPEAGGHGRNTLLHFLKGKSSITKFWWGRTISVEYLRMNSGSVPHSWEISLPEVAEMLKIGLDVRRLAPEIVAFSEPEPEVAILYSRTSIVQVPPNLHRAGRTPYLAALRGTWEGSRYLGCRIGFVSERQITGGKLDKFKLLIIPAAKYIRPEAARRVLSWVESGGTALVVPESFLFDQYARPNDLTAGLGVKVTDVTLPEVLGRGEMQQNYDQSLSHAVVYGDVKREMVSENIDIFAGREQVRLRADGLVQKLEAPGGRVLARFEDGGPSLVLTARGKGVIYYLAAPLVDADYHLLLEPLAEKLGIERPLVGVNPDGGLVTGAVVRAVERERDWLMFACNITGETVEFDIAGQDPLGRITELRSLEKLPDAHIELKPYQEIILQIAKPGVPLGR
ncbi:MAG: family 14 glycosylhydrolase [Candidatus Glassbacteria bacterium]|nr:family 14 glycosylhydrolase [Candidatus Glassbacteria bacterium]